MTIWRKGEDGIATWETLGAKTGAKVEEKFARDAAQTEGVVKEGAKGSASALQSFDGRTLDDLVLAAGHPVNKEVLAMKLESNPDFEILGFSNNRYEKLTIEIQYKAHPVAQIN
jgi:hypothetical protein